MAQTNENGLTYTEWLNAAHIDWYLGEGKDPTDWRAAGEMERRK